MVIPIHDRNPVRRATPVTYGLIAANFVVFLLGPVARAGVGGQTASAACSQERYFLEYGAVPVELVNNHQLTVRQVALVPSALGCHLGALPHKLPVFSVFEAMFIHASWLHLLGNMLFLFVFGNNVEDRMGRLHFLVFYLAAGYLATYMFAVFNPHSLEPLVGASGAISGALGAYLYLFPRAKVTSLVPFLFFIPLRFPAWLVLGSWFVLQLPAVQHALGMPTDSGVAYAAHITGFIAGFVYAVMVVRPEPPWAVPPGGDVPPAYRAPYQ